MNKKYLHDNSAHKFFILDEINKNFKQFLYEDDELLRYYKTNDGKVGFVKFGEALPLNSVEISKEQYENLRPNPNKPSSPLDVGPNYSWQNQSLKGIEERMPPVKYSVVTVSNPGEEIPTGLYMGKPGNYDQQMQEHISFMKKWFKDNQPGEDFYKNNMFYSMGEDGLPKFNTESLENHIVGLHAEEANEYFAKKNNLLTDYNKQLSELKKTHEATTQRLDVEKKEIIKNYGPPSETLYKKPDYDPQGALGATLSSPTSGSIATGSKDYDSWVRSGGQKNYYDKLLQHSKKIESETKNYSSQFSKIKNTYDSNLKKLNNEYIHPDFEWGIKKGEYDLYRKLNKAQKDKWEEINKKKIEEAKKLWKEKIIVSPDDLSDEQKMGWFQQTFSQSPDAEKKQKLIQQSQQEIKNLADKPIVNWVKDETLKKQVELQKLKVKTENLILNEIYEQELEMIQLSFGRKTDKQKEEERLANRPWYTRAVDLTNYDVHDWMMLISLTCMVIPGLQGCGIAMRVLGVAEATALGIGLTDAAIIAAAVDLVDAGIYVSEGNWELAGLSVLFALVPFAIESQFVKRLGAEGLKKMAQFAKAVPDAFLKGTGNMTMEELYRYTKFILDEDTQRAIKVMAENSSELIGKVKNAYKAGSEKILTQTGAKILNDGVTSTLKFSYNGMKYLAPKLVSLGKVGVTFSGYMAMGQVYHEGIQYTNENIIKTPKSVAESLGLEWNLLKSEFKSDGSEKDNTLLKDAITMGWRPGIPVPLQFQTNTYKKWLSDQKLQQSKKIKETLSTEEFEKKIVEVLKQSSVTQNLIEDKTKQKKQEVIDWTKENDEEIDRMGEELIRKALEEQNANDDSGQNK